MSKSIIWESWNAIADDYIDGIHGEIEQLEEDLKDIGSEGLEAMGLPPMPIISTNESVIHTPLGPYPIDSMFKPSDRWDCRIGVTNFDITYAVKETLKTTKGVEALRILGRYTFFIGVPRTFDFRDVRTSIEKELCVFTEEEVMTEETVATVEMVKEQLKNNKYWSILVASTGKVDYIVSDRLDQKYLEGLNKLEELKQDLGGIILRGNDG